MPEMNVAPKTTGGDQISLDQTRETGQEYTNYMKGYYMKGFDQRMVIVLHICWEQNMGTSVLFAEMEVRLNGCKGKKLSIC